MMPRLTPWITIPLLLLAVACQEQGASDERVLARIGEEVITVAEFEREMARRSEGRPTFFQQADNRRALLDELVRQRMLVAEARDAGIADEPEFRALVERMLIQRLRENRLAEKLAASAPSDEAVAAYYQANIEAFSRPARRQVAMIRVDSPAGSDDEQRAAHRARIDAARAAAGELAAEITHFGEIAVAHSDDRSSRYQGGVVGWLIDGPQRRYQWPDPVLEAAFDLDEPGEMTPVIETAEAFYLVRLAAMEPGRVQPLEQVADGIRHRLARERGNELERELFVDIEQRRAAEIDEAMLESIEAPPGIAEEPDPRRVPPALPADPAASTE